MDAKQLKADYQMTFGTEHGQRVLDDILKYSHVLEPMIGSIETNALIIKQGRRDVGLTILERLNYDERKFTDHVKGA